MSIGSLFRPWLLLIVIGLGAAVVALTQSHGPSFSPDSTVYVEQARNIIAGRGPLSTPLAIETLAATEHSPLFPPGFAASMAVLSRLTSIPPETAGSVLSMLSLAALPLLCFLSFRSSVGRVRAALIGVFAATCSLDYGASVLSDLYSLALALLAAALLMNGRGWWRGLLCGAFAALAYSVRNAHVALLAALAIYVGAGLAAGDYRNRERLGFAIGTAGSCGLLVAALSLWRLLVFHSLQPYVMDPSTVGVWQNLRDLILASVSYLQPKELVLAGFGTSSKLLIAAAALVFGCWLGFCIRKWPSLSEATRRALVFCSLYALLGSATLIAASSRWDWGEYINARHIVQYGPFIAMMCAVTTLPGSSLRARCLIVAFGALVVFSVCYRAQVYYRVALRDEANPPSAVFIRRLVDAAAALRTPLASVRIPAFDFGDTNSTDYMCSNREPALLVSNLGFLYDLKCGRRVRTVWQERDAAGGDRRGEAALALVEAARHSRGRAVIAVMVAADSSGNSTAAHEPLFTPASTADAQALGWNIVRNEPDGLVATKAGATVVQ